ncbi:hypothetical protein A3E39_01155 [Candidatus Uhrbacteria bacterium RIFCSPHIGHO2_12_FULL_60_25]|uniref:Uncharacterized protein n=1 Tax=Candidatus Uhrbacteria bacterium RIFCSPHIGHO2_12_FULL_60_25 TaxID=1802399 RepID=A0A1F7UKF1_9BACT|nr:MAG: hypothetical protein A3D73_02330 [Candidatus Uhrbacteria bacterium RIFCSPHIGHO2_02_FULL_60_44]OGL78752.1 MAG: hypothetical protein A3E39_01155 [Candidatus Uhrbacteria bacterium RIFCSPHIGHO2_12_FULL_60_25]
MSRSFDLKRYGERAWWVGVPVLTGLVSWVPYWIWNVSAHVERWWRVPAVTPGVFDTYVYLHWMGAAANGLAYGGHLKWFGSLIIVALWKLVGSWASVPELWIVSRWIAITLTLWIGAWCVEQWSGIARWPSRAVIAGLWLSLLPLSLRPGMYSWYLPFCMLGLTLVLPAYEALKKDRYVRSIGLSVASLLLTTLYPWFLMPAGLWLATIWAARFVRLRTWTLPVLVALSVITVWTLAGPLAEWFLDPARAGLVGMYERNGMVFARVPFFANTVLAMLAWIAFLFALARRAASPAARDRLTFAAWGWIVLFFLWFNTPFTGIHIYSDHFIAPVAVLAWLSLATVWGLGTGDWETGTGKRGLGNALIKQLPLVVAAGATLFFVYVLQQPLRSNIWKFDSYVIHLTHWFALAVAAWLVVWRSRHTSSHLNTTVVTILITLPMAAIGVGASIPVILRDFPKVPEVMVNVPVVDWIRSHVPPGDMMCADPGSASFYAAHTGRRVNPAEPTLSYPDSSEQVIRDLETLVGAYSVTSSGELWFFRFYTGHYRTIPCAEGSKYSHNAFYADVLRRMGFDQARANELIGCRQAVIDANWKRVEAAINRHTLDKYAFRAFCPWVIIPDPQSAFWQLPAGYVEEHVGNNVSVWKKP